MVNCSEETLKSFYVFLFVCVFFFSSRNCENIAKIIVSEKNIDRASANTPTKEKKKKKKRNPIEVKHTNTREDRQK